MSLVLCSDLSSYIQKIMGFIFCCYQLSARFLLRMPTFGKIEQHTHYEHLVPSDLAEHFFGKISRFILVGPNSCGIWLSG